MKKEFKEVPVAFGTAGNHKRMRYTLDVTQKNQCDLTAQNGRSGITFKDVLTPSRKSSVLADIWLLRQTEGYRYTLSAYTTAERENSAYCNEGYIEAPNFDEAEEKLKEMAKEFLVICLCQESQRCLDLAETLINKVTRPTGK